MDIKYSVKTMREAGLEAKWGRINGAPFMFLRDPNGASKHQRETWWALDKGMWHSMHKDGIREAFTAYTLLGNFFSI